MERQFNSCGPAESLEQVISTFRHEIGNSANSLKITLDVLRENFDDYDNDKRKEYLERVSQIIARQHKMVSALKTYSKFQVERPEKISFSTYWEKFLVEIQKKLETREVRLNYDDKMESGLIMVDVIALNQVIENILSNALEALENSDAPSAELWATRKGDSLVIRLKDNGSGIPKTDIPKVFIPLFSTKPGRMGMGLPVARKLLCNMNGSLEINSEFGHGTEAIIRLNLIHC